MTAGVLVIAFLLALLSGGDDGIVLFSIGCVLLAAFGEALEARRKGRSR